MTKLLTLLEIKQHHQIECPEVSLEFFMEQYARQLMERDFNIVVVEIKVSDRFAIKFKR